MLFTTATKILFSHVRKVAILLCLLPQPQKQTRKNASRDLHKFSLQKFHNHKVSSISIKFPSMKSLTYLNFNVIRIKDDGNGGNIQLFLYLNNKISMFLLAIKSFSIICDLPHQHHHHCPYHDKNMWWQCTWNKNSDLF